MSWTASWIQKRYRQQLNEVMATREVTDLTHSAIVFAPHPDDETLGCGGTIIRKKAAGASIQLVFMTDGSQSHASLIDPSQLKAMRRQEAIAAAKTLGVEATDVTFLDFQDGQLSQHVAAATERVKAVLQAHPTEEIFVPYALEPPADHAATYEAVAGAIRQLAAAGQLAVKPQVYAYPVWYWEHWPWMAPAGKGKKDALRMIGTSIKSGFGAAVFKDFQHAVYIEPAIAQKRAALNQHVSQMKKPDGSPDWSILSEIANGDFLACFFQNYEIFHRPSL